MTYYLKGIDGQILQQRCTSVGLFRSGVSLLKDTSRGNERVQMILFPCIREGSRKENNVTAVCSHKHPQDSGRPRGRRHKPLSGLSSHSTGVKGLSLAKPEESLRTRAVVAA